MITAPRSFLTKSSIKTEFGKFTNPDHIQTGWNKYAEKRISKYENWKTGGKTAGKYWKRTWKVQIQFVEQIYHLNFRKMIIIIYAAVVVAIVLLALWFSFRDADHHKHPAWYPVTTHEFPPLTYQWTLLHGRFWHLPDNSFIPYFLCLFSSYNHPFRSCKLARRCWTIQNNIKSLLFRIKRIKTH